MGLFSDKCTAIVSLNTGRCLTGDALAEARRIVAEETGTFHSQSAVLAAHGWGLCGHDVKKKARFCSKCGAPAPKGWIKCPSCGKWVGNEMTHCWNCNHPLHPETRTNLEGGVWNRAEGLFAERFEVGEVENMLKNGLQIQEGSAAILLDAGKQSSVLGPGRHDPDGILRKINWFGAPPPRSAVLVDAGEFIVPLRMTEGLVTAENFPISVYAELTLKFNRDNADDFMANFMKDARQITYAEISTTLSATLVYGIRNLCTTSTAEDLVKDPGRRDQFEAAIRAVASETLKAWSLEVVRVGAADFDSPKYREVENQNAGLVEKRRELEFLVKTRELLNADAARNRELDAEERATADGGKMDAAKAERDLAEYLDQLAQEKELAGRDRAEELEVDGLRRDSAMKLLLLAKRHEITTQEANYRLAEQIAARAAEMEAELKDTDHDIALKEKLRAYTVEAMLKDELGQEEKLKIQVREEELKASIEKTKIALEAYRLKTLEIARTDVDEDRIRRIAKAEADAAVAKAEAEATRVREMGKATNEVESGRLDNERKHMETLVWADGQIDESKRKTRAQELDFAKNASVEALIATSDDPEKMKALVEFARVNAQKGMSADQLLGQAAATRDAAANAFAAKAISEKETMDRLVEEIKKLAGANSAKDERILTTLAGVMAEAAKRPDAPPPPPTQQIIK